jgi:hypothetical protein
LNIMIVLELRGFAILQRPTKMIYDRQMTSSRGETTAKLHTNHAVAT